MSLKELFMKTSVASSSLALQVQQFLEGFCGAAGALAHLLVIGNGLCTASSSLSQPRPGLHSPCRADPLMALT